MTPTDKLSVYVSASSHELERARAAMRALKQAGCTIAYDWTNDVEQHGPLGVGFPGEDQACENDLKGVASCHLLWLLVPTPPLHSRGAWVELGAALVNYTPVIASGTWDVPIWRKRMLERVVLGDAARADEHALLWILSNRETLLKHHEEVQRKLKEAEGEFNHSEFIDSIV